MGPDYIYTQDDNYYSLSTVTYTHSNFTCLNFLPLNCRSEVVQVFKGGVIRSIATGFNFNVAKSCIIYLIVLSSTLSGGGLSIKSVITTLALINVVRITVVVFAVRCFFTVYEGYVAIIRIQVALRLSVSCVSNCVCPH